VLGGIGYTVLQLVGHWYVQRAVNGAEDTYGAFAVVIGLLGWLYVLSQWSILAAEVTVVHARGLWPRSLQLGRPTEADKQIVRAAARSAQLRPDTEIVVRFGQGG
jgi:membrane protein